MAKVSFLRISDVGSVLKSPYAHSTELLNKARGLMDQEAILAEAFINLMNEDTTALKNLGYCEYTDSGIEAVFSDRFAHNRIERVRLLAEAKCCRDEASAILGWVKETFQINDPALVKESSWVK